jgi:hypothetical protein
MKPPLNGNDTFYAEDSLERDLAIDHLFSLGMDGDEEAAKVLQEIVENTDGDVFGWEDPQKKEAVRLCIPKAT